MERVRPHFRWARRLAMSTLLLSPGCTPHAEKSRTAACEVYTGDWALDPLDPEFSCADQLTSLPYEVASDLVRCITEVRPWRRSGQHRRVRACLAPETHEELERRVRARELVEVFTFDPDPFGKAPLSVDPWGQPLRAEQTQDGFQICTLGTDLTRGTYDDHCQDGQMRPHLKRGGVQDAEGA